MTNAEPTINSVVTSIIDPFGSLCLQNRSNIKFTISATAKYGATITNYAVSGNNFSYAGSKNTCQTSNIRDSGSLNIQSQLLTVEGLQLLQQKQSMLLGIPIQLFLWRRLEVIQAVQRMYPVALIFVSNQYLRIQQ